MPKFGTSACVRICTQFTVAIFIPSLQSLQWQCIVSPSVSFIKRKPKFATTFIAMKLISWIVDVGFWMMKTGMGVRNMRRLFKVTIGAYVYIYHILYCRSITIRNRERERKSVSAQKQQRPP